VSLIQDLAELEALEDAEDLKDARQELAKAEAAAGSRSSSGTAEFCNTADENDPSEATGTVPYEQIRRELGLDR